MKKHLSILLFLLILGLVGYGLFSNSTFNLGSLLHGTKNYSIPTAFATGTQEAFDQLSTTQSETRSFCGLQPQAVDGFSEQESIQGSCCSVMDFHRYQEQVEGLKKYADIPEIPKDPYNIPVLLAKDLFEYQQTITLDQKQQAVYDQAMEMSEEGGPCCCKCWRWTAFEGQAKYLITEYGFTAEQIAQVWDLEDGCGGAGHEH